MDREAMLSQILEWSEQMDVIVTKIEDPIVDFHLTLSEPNLPTIGIIHPKPENRFVVFHVRVTPPEEIQKKLLELDAKQRSEIVSDIRLRLLSSKLEFRIEGAETGVPNAYGIFSKFFLEKNTLQNFWQTYVQMKNFVILISYLHRKFLGLT